jgi:hypothetical protein
MAYCSIFFLPKRRVEDQDDFRCRNESHRPQCKPLLLGQRRVEADEGGGGTGRGHDGEVAQNFGIFFGAVVASTVDSDLMMEIFFRFVFFRNISMLMFEIFSLRIQIKKCFILSSRRENVHI